VSDFAVRFHELERNVFKHWDRSDPDHLAGAATSALAAEPELLDFDAGECLAWAVCGSVELPTQSWQFDFGQPAITVARNDDFRIDLLYWLENASATHDHVTCGAFAAMLGERLHGIYQFHGERDLDPQVRLGDLRRTELGIMRESEICAIRPEFIHDLFWLEKPTVTLVIRCASHPEPPRKPREYIAPGFAYVAKEHHETSRVDRQAEGLDLLRQASGERYADALLAAFESTDAALCYYAFLNAAIAAPEVLDSIVDRVASPSPAFTALLGARRELVRRSFFGGVYAPDEVSRLAAGLLWAGAAPDDATRILASLYPGQQPTVLMRAAADALEGLSSDAANAASELAASMEMLV
jgi:hypothetical protein